MNSTVQAFEKNKFDAKSLFADLKEFLETGLKLGFEVDLNSINKVDDLIGNLNDDKLKVTLIGGFSEGKTSIAAAWMERLDKSSMNINQKESSDQVKMYDIDENMTLIDTPGLFGFKEKFNADSQAIEKFRDITKKFVSESHLILYVMDPVNPIKESHQSDLEWLFRDLDLLDRTVFVLGRFDMVADIEEEDEFQRIFSVKKDNVLSRLGDLISLKDYELSGIEIVAVAADPFEFGAEYWLKNLEKFRSLSRIGFLQAATTRKISSKGANMLKLDSLNSIKIDLLNRYMPIAEEKESFTRQEIYRLVPLISRLEGNIDLVKRNIATAQDNLRSFVVNYFTDLIMQSRGLGLETFNDFFEREIGNQGIIISNRIQSEFERQLEGASLEIGKVRIDLDSSLKTQNQFLSTAAVKGSKYIVEKKLINENTVLAARDGVVSFARFFKLDLSKFLKFKPWTAVNFAKNLNGALAVFGLIMEINDSFNKATEADRFKQAIEDIISNLESQRKELLEILNSPEFATNFLPDYINLKNQLTSLRSEIAQKENLCSEISNWRAHGRSISLKFQM